MRLFIAINLDPRVRESIYKVFSPLRRHPLPFRWVPPENIHLTLKFLNEVAEDRVRRVSNRISEVCRHLTPFTIACKGVGFFESRGLLRVLWVGAQGGEDLGKVHRDLERVLDREGFPPDGHRFHPHLTVARNRKAFPWDSIREFAGRYRDHRFGVQRVDALSLVRSKLTPGGARYSVVKEYALE